MTRLPESRSTPLRAGWIACLAALATSCADDPLDDHRWSAVTAGWSMSCGVRYGGVECWGDSAGGVLGRGDIAAGVHPPTAVEW